MCGPEYLFAAQAAAALGGAVMGSSSDMSAYNRKVGAINTEADALEKSLIFKYQIAGVQEKQAQDKATIQTGDARLKLAEAQGEAGAAAAEGGIEGLSVDRLMRSFATATGKDISNIWTQRDNEVGQTEAEKKGYSIDAKNRLASLKSELPEDPSMKMLGRFFGAAFNVGDAFLKNTTPVGKGQSGGIFGRRFG